MIYPRETKEFQPFRVTVDGIEVVDDVEVSVVRPGIRPTVWVPPTVLDSGGLAVLLNEVELGSWNLWARITTEHEKAVVYCGDFKIT